MPENEDIYITDVMQRTLRVQFGGSVFNVNKMEDVVELFSPLVNPAEYEAVYKCGEGKEWYIQFRSEDPVLRLGDSGTLSLQDGVNVTITRIDRRKIDFRIHWYPLFMNTAVLFQFMNSIGRQCRMDRMTKNVKGVEIQSGVLQGSMIVSEKEYSRIPYRQVIHGREVLITINGRQPKCLKCGEYGHNRSKCTKRGQGNRNSDKQSYAGAVRNDSEVAGSDDESETTGQVNGPYGPGFSDKRDHDSDWNTVSRRRRNRRVETSNVAPEAPVTILDGSEPEERQEQEGSGADGRDDDSVTHSETEMDTGNTGLLTQIARDVEKSKLEDGVRKRPFEHTDTDSSVKKSKDVNGGDELSNSQEHDSLDLHKDDR